MVLYNMTC